MELTQIVLVKIIWVCLILLAFSSGCKNDVDITNTISAQDEVTEPRGRHRLQLLFPLLLRISTRLATLVPTALMGLFGIILFIVFSKKAFILSFFALLLALSGKNNAKNDEIYLHKIDSYSDYNNEEHTHHHHGLMKHRNFYNYNRPEAKLKTHYKRTIFVPAHTPNVIPLYKFKEVHVKPFKPLFFLQQKTDV